MAKLAEVAPVSHSSKNQGQTTRAGWSLYREPSTKNPPDVLRLHYRDGEGRLARVINIQNRKVVMKDD